jgi:hypothetical protein
MQTEQSLDRVGQWKQDAEHSIPIFDTRDVTVSTSATASIRHHAHAGTSDGISPYMANIPPHSGLVLASPWSDRIQTARVLTDSKRIAHIMRPCNVLLLPPELFAA